MSEYGTRTPEENDGPVPRDLPDQQVQEGEDPWDVITPSGPGEGRDSAGGPAGDDAESAGDGPEAQPDSGAADTGAADTGAAGGAASGDEQGTGVPDTDEAGTGRQGDPNTSTVHPEDPEPQESSG